MAAFFIGIAVDYQFLLCKGKAMVKVLPLPGVL